MPRYVILLHDHPEQHWDLMLERDGQLQTWRLAAPPEQRTQVAAIALANHRLAYLDYEGPISGGRGQVTRWDSGQFTILSESPLVVMLQGSRWSGQAAWRPADGPPVWEFVTTSE